MLCWASIRLAILEKIKIADLSKNIPIIHPQKYYLGIILTTIGWILIAQYTTVLERVHNTSNQTINQQCMHLFVEMFVLYASMLLFFLPFVLFFKKKYYKCVSFFGVSMRSILAYVSFVTMSLAKVLNNSIDNTILFTLDPLWIVIICSFIKISIPKSQKILILISSVVLIYILKQDILHHSVLSWIFGAISGQTFAIVILMTSYLVKNDPPIRIGLYMGIIGAILSLILIVAFIPLFTFQPISFNDILSMIYSGLIFSIALFCFLEAFYYTEAYIIGVASLVLPIFVIWNGWILDRTKITSESLIGTILSAIITLYIFFSEYLADRRTH